MQGQIPYLFRGVDNGNNIAEPTARIWELRFGDCKAKMLLLAVLHRLGTEADPELAKLGGCRLVAQRLPSAAEFYHILSLRASRTPWPISRPRSPCAPQEVALRFPDRIGVQA